jgi:hypothetical protein
LALDKTGNSIAARIAMMAMTTSSSINVNARQREWVVLIHDPLNSVFFCGAFLFPFIRLYYGRVVGC